MKSHRIAGCFFVVLCLLSVPAAACEQHQVVVDTFPVQDVCVGGTATINAFAHCREYCPIPLMEYSWSAPGGEPSSGTGIGGIFSFNCTYDSAGDKPISVMATCGSGWGQTSVTVFVVRVASVTASKNPVCTGENVTFTAVSYPSGKSLGCLQWEKRWRNAGSSTWGNWQPAGSGNFKTDSSSVPGYLQYSARNGTSAWESTIATVVGLASLQSNKEVVGVGEDVDFSVETSPIDYYNDINWSGGGSPATQSGGQTFTTSWSTPGTKTVTASCGSSSISKEVEVIDGLTVLPGVAYVGVDGQKSFAAWTVENGSATDVTSSSIFTTSNGGFEDNVLTDSLTPSDSIGADWVKATYNDVTTDADHDCDLTVFIVNITDSAGIEITGVTTVSVGQKVNLGHKVEPSDLTTSDIQWTVPGTIVKDYTVTEESASKTDMSTEDFQDETVGFYWVTGGNPLEVRIDCTVEGIVCDDAVEFNVQRPVMSYFNSRTGSVAVLHDGANYGLMPVNSFGDAGMTPNIRVTQPSSCHGLYKVFQLCETYNTRTNNDDILEVLQTTGFWFDDFGDDRVPFPGVTITYDEDDFSDTPIMPCYSGYKIVTAKDLFKLYFMYKPQVSGAIWVPVGLLSWDWYGTAKTTDGGVTWTLESGGHDLGDNPSGGDTTEFPEWSNRIVRGVNPDWE